MQLCVKITKMMLHLITNSNASVTMWWRRSVVVSGVGLINEVNRHCDRLVLGWVTVCGLLNHLGM